MGHEYSDRLRAFSRGMIQEQFDQLNDTSQKAFMRLYGDIGRLRLDEMPKIYDHNKRCLRMKSCKRS